LAAVIPPIWLIERGTSTRLDMPFVPGKPSPREFQTQLPKAVDLLSNNLRKLLPDRQTPNRPRAATDEIIEIRIGSAMRQTRAEEIAIHYTKAFGQSLLFALHKIDS
jgi:hypothetical protein